MPNFIDDDTALPATKVDRRAIPPGESATKFWQASDGNAVFAALEDTRDAVQALQAGGGGGTSQELRITPEGPWDGGTLANLAVGVINDYSHTSLQTNSVVIVRGADNEGTVITGIDSTGINTGDVRIFVNLSVSGIDVGTINFTHQDTGSLAANRIICPGSVDLTLPHYGTLMFVYGEDARWHPVALNGWLHQTKTQAFQLYPNLEVGPISGTKNDWSPTGNTTYTGTGRGLAGGDLNFGKYALVRVLTDAGGATITGIDHRGDLNADPWDLGTVKILMNYGPGNLVLSHLNAGSDILNRLYIPGEADLTLHPYETAILVSPLGDPNPSQQWRVIAMAVSNRTFPSVTTTSSVTAQQLILTPSVTPSTLAKFTTATSNYNPGTNTTIRITTHADGSLIDGLVPTGTGDVRILVNVSSGPLIMLDETNSASTSGNRFLLPGGRLVVVPGRSSIMLRYDSTLGGWLMLSDGGFVRGNESNLLAIVPSTLAASNVNDYNPTDATTGLPGRYAYWWKVSGAVGTNLTGIDAAPSGLPAFADGDRILMTNLVSGLTIKHASGSSSASNRIFCPGNADVVLASNGTAEFIRHGGGSVWYLAMKAN